MGRGAEFLAISIFSMCISTTAIAAENSFFDLMSDQNFDNNVVMLIIFVGAFAFAMWSATWLIRERRQLDDNNRSMALEFADLKARYDKAEALLDVPDQRVVIWEGPNASPVCRGTLPNNTGAPENPAKFIGFGIWMTPHSAQSFEASVERLLEQAEGFDLTVETKTGRMIEVQGRASGTHAFVRFISLSGERAALAELEIEYTKLLQTTDTMKSLLEVISFPVWMRDADGNLGWANSAYVGAVEGGSLEQVSENNIHLLDASERQQIAKVHSEARKNNPTSHFRERLPATISGDRRMMDISEISYEGGSAGLAVDMSEVEEVQANLRRTIESHTQTMNQLATAVAIFDGKKHLIFYNQAFESLWQLDAKLLDSKPDNGRLFDAMREAGKIAEQPDWVKWRDDLLQIYEETQPQEHWWHLPDNRTLRVISNPHKQGGVTWVFENITEQLEMESRYITLTQVQGETLDHLSEAIAVFAPDGTLKLSNPSFQALWKLEDEQVAAGTAISSIAEQCHKYMEDPGIWDSIKLTITGVSDKRNTTSDRLTLQNGAVLDYALVPLPNGQTLVSFADVSANVKLEDTLNERNEALEAAERLKNAFIEHVSYEFRAPLTSIKGFAEVLEQKSFGPLNKKQAEYIGHITSSSNVLHALVDNLLDLATVDAGIMELDLQQIDVRDVMRTAAASMSAHLEAKNVKLNIKQLGGAGKFIADADRVEQVLHNLLSNALGFSPEDSVITLESRVEDNFICLSVIDRGPGIPEDQRDTIFERFNRVPHSGGRRGAGLGLSIARSLVELHGGTIEVDGSAKIGTSFVCRFPKLPKAEMSPAAHAAQ